MRALRAIGIAVPTLFLVIVADLTLAHTLVQMEQRALSESQYQAGVAKETTPILTDYLANAGQLITVGQMLGDLASWAILLGWILLGCTLALAVYALFLLRQSGKAPRPADLRGALLRTVSELEAYDRKIAAGQLEASRVRKESRDLALLLDLNRDQIGAISRALNPRSRRKVLLEAALAVATFAGLLIAIIQISAQ